MESDHICIFHRRPFLHFLLILMSSIIDKFTAYLPSMDRGSVKNSWTSHTSGYHKRLSNLTPLHFCLNHPTHGLPLITSPSKMTTVLIRRNAPTDSCHSLTALMPRCTNTSFLITPHYICAHRNSDNLHNAGFIGYSLVARGMADEHLIVVLHLMFLHMPLSLRGVSDHTLTTGH